jgi:hypothetical protein
MNWLPEVPMPWLRTYIAACAVVVVLLFLGLGLLVSFVDLGLSGHGIAALFLGALFTVAVGMVLMGLVFSSSRGGQDEGVHRMRRDDGRGTGPDLSIR